MATKTAYLPFLPQQSGVYYAFVRSVAGTLLNTGGDVLTHVAGGLFTFDLTESLAALEYALVTVHSSSTATQQNAVWYGAVTEDSDLCFEQVPPTSVATGGGGGGGDALAAAIWTAGEIVGFPEELAIGDSYVEDLGRHIKVYYREEDDTPITEIGDKTFVDLDFEALLYITQDNASSRVKATCEWVPAVGPVEGYVKVELPKDQTRRAGAGVATMQLVFRWGNTFEVEIATQTVVWRQKIIGA